jgi:hypothetical protein
MFKLDEVAIEATGGGYGTGGEAYSVMVELSRQIRDAGGPEGDLGAQLAALLTSHKAMTETGEEMPTIDALCILACGGDGAEQTPEARRGLRAEMARAQDLFRPIVARLRARIVGQAAVDAANARAANAEKERHDAANEAQRLALLLARAEAKLARVEGITTEDITSRVANGVWGDDPVAGILALIRSRLSDGAEDATCSASIGIPDEPPKPPPPPPGVADRCGGIHFHTTRLQCVEVDGHPGVCLFVGPQFT